MIYAIVEYPSFKLLTLDCTIGKIMERLELYEREFQAITFYKPHELARCIEDYPDLPRYHLTDTWANMASKYNKDKKNEI
jgi:hypothetical protein